MKHLDFDQFFVSGPENGALASFGESSRSISPQFLRAAERFTICIYFRDHSPFMGHARRQRLWVQTERLGSSCSRREALDEHVGGDDKRNEEEAFQD